MAILEKCPPACLERLGFTGANTGSKNPKSQVVRPKQRIGRKTPSPNKEIRNSQPNSPLTPFWASHQQFTCHVPISPNQGLFNSGSYAGARFHSPPTADVLPKPPQHWVNVPSCAQQMQNQQLNELSTRLKGMLKVPS
ncbi:uncharacterized protein LOC100177436 [Ciona intestinalis]